MAEIGSHPVSTTDYWDFSCTGFYNFYSLLMTQNMSYLHTNKDYQNKLNFKKQSDKIGKYRFHIDMIEEWKNSRLKYMIKKIHIIYFHSIVWQKAQNMFIDSKNCHKSFTNGLNNILLIGKYWK